jgi:Carboxypeptidase regulatory-like domain
MDTEMKNGFSTIAPEGPSARMLAALIVIGACCASSLGAGGEPTEQNVAGVVMRVDGSEVPGACVSARAVGASAGNMGCTKTDEHGAFTMRLRPGEYVIRAKDEAEGYPDPSFLLSADPTAKFPQVVVGQSDISGVHVTLGAKGGVLEGKVQDEATRLPIVGAKITISDARSPGAYVEVFSKKDGGFQFIVPAKPVFIFATAIGYENGRAEEVALSGGQHRSIEIDLRPR